MGALSTKLYGQIDTLWTVSTDMNHKFITGAQFISVKQSLAQLMSFWTGPTSTLFPCTLSLSHLSLILIFPILSLPPQALLSLVYLCSRDIFALINYVGFTTWVTASFKPNYLYTASVSRQIKSEDHQSEDGLFDEENEAVCSFIAEALL